MYLNRFSNARPASSLARDGSPSRIHQRHEKGLDEFFCFCWLASTQHCLPATMKRTESKTTSSSCSEVSRHQSRARSRTCLMVTPVTTLTWPYCRGQIWGDGEKRGLATVYQVIPCVMPPTKARAVHLDKCCEYWYFNATNKENPNREEFKFPVEMALELLIAADFLDCNAILLPG